MLQAYLLRGECRVAQVSPDVPPYAELDSPRARAKPLACIPGVVVRLPSDRQRCGQVARLIGKLLGKQLSAL